MSRSVIGKSAIVTGAGSGINYSFAKLLLENGCNVLIGDLALRPEAQTLIETYTSSPKALFLKTDVSSWPSLTALFEFAEKSFTTYDILCPGAGVFEPLFSNFWHPPGSANSKDDKDGSHYKSLDINLTHPIRATQLAISHFLASGHTASSADSPKTVVLISSIAGEIAFAPTPLYIASKWGLRGFIYALAELEETRGIRVAGLCPAIVRTPIWLDSEDKRRMVLDGEGKEQTEWTTPEEVAQVMFKLCTENQATNAAGDIIPLRGGSLIEVIHDDIRDVPMFENKPPGTGTEGKGLLMASVTEAWKDMNAAVEGTKNWGKVF